jgi:hypothetical protein
MSQWLERRSVHLSAVSAWAIALIAAVTLAGSTLPFMAVLWAGICVGLAYQVLKRRWWTAIALVALSAQTVLNVATEGSHSQRLHRAVFAVQLALIVFFAISMVIDGRTRQRT